MGLWLLSACACVRGFREHGVRFFLEPSEMLPELLPHPLPTEMDNICLCLTQFICKAIPFVDLVNCWYCETMAKKSYSLKKSSKNKCDKSYGFWDIFSTSLRSCFNIIYVEKINSHDIVCFVCVLKENIYTNQFSIICFWWFLIPQKLCIENIQHYKTIYQKLRNL